VYSIILNRKETYTTLLEKLINTHLVKKFPSFYGNRMFIAIFIRTHHWALP